MYSTTLHINQSAKVNRQQNITVPTYQHSELTRPTGQPLLQASRQ